MDDYKILIVDDEEINRDILSDFLEEKFNIDVACNGQEAIDKVSADADQFIAMLLDLQMPNMDGFEVLKKLNEMKLMDSIPVLVITGEKTMSNEKKCFELGVTEFIQKPFEPYIVLKRVENIVKMSRNQRYLAQKVKEQTQILQSQYRLLQSQNEQLGERNKKIIDVMGSIVEYRHLESGEHINRVKQLTKALANHVMKECPKYGLNQKKVNMIVDVSPLHDLGKIAIPDKILQKPGRLTDDEFDFMKSHTVRGCDILETLYDLWEPELKQVCYNVCRSHHEKYDGKGYPDGLVGDDIPIEAQIVSIADVYDALVSDRVYKSAYTPEEAYHMIISGECGMFSPYLLECLRSAKDEFEQIVKKTKEAYNN